MSNFLDFTKIDSLRR